MRFSLILIFAVIFFLGSNAKTYVVCVGIAKYEDRTVPPLNKSENDAKAMAEFYKQGKADVTTITGKAATKRRILQTLSDIYSKAGTEDKIIFYFSGHGYAGGFCPYDVHSLNDGIKYTELMEIMNKSEAETKMVFADACNSGLIRTESLPKGTVLFFLASRGGENSYESDSPFATFGYFTKNLLRGLRGAADRDNDLKISAQEIFDYVSATTKEATRGDQHPVMWGNFPNDMVIVKYNRK